MLPSTIAVLMACARDCGDPCGTTLASWLGMTIGAVIGFGLARALGRPFAARSIVVITDGRWNTGPNPIALAQEAAAMGITIHAVTFSFEADQATMQAMAEAAHGKYWHAPDGETLMEIFRTIADNNPTLLTQ